jgi:hypothetical protein
MSWPLSPTATQRTATGTKTASGDQELIATPGAGFQLLIASIVLQNESSTATTMILKAGSTAIARCLGQNQGDGAALIFPFDRPLQIGANTALNLNLSGANSCGYSIVYYIDTV